MCIKSEGDNNIISLSLEHFGKNLQKNLKANVFILET